MRRLNQPFLWLLIIAGLAILSRIVFVHHYWIPSLIRFHLADFGFPAVFTVFLSILITLITPRRFRLEHERGMRWLYLATALAGIIQGLRIEFEDLVGEEQTDFDVGVLLSRWFGAPNTETFDWLDVLAICLGGIIVMVLQWYSIKHIRVWKRFPLFLKV